MRPIYKNKLYQLEIYVDQDRELWICNLNGRRKVEFDHLETMLKYLVDFYTIKNVRAVKEFGEVSAELGEVYGLIRSIARSRFVGLRES